MELTIGQLIKIIIGIVVVVVVITAIGFFFKESVIDFFKNMIDSGVPENTTKLVLSLV